MKPHLLTPVALLLFGGMFAADPSPLPFGGERIGTPPLSLTESLAQRSKTPMPLQFGTKLPQFFPGTEGVPLTPNLVPRPAPDLKSLEAARSARAPRVSRTSGMPIIEPGDAVDYKLRIVTPNPSIDFKLIIKNPALTSEDTSTK